MVRNYKSHFFSFLSAIIIGLFSNKRRKPIEDDFKRIDFSTSTQRLGIHFPDKIRDVFRFKWIKSGN
jgi:hypothetical protein